MDASHHASSTFEKKKQEYLEKIRLLNEIISPIALPTNVVVRIFSYVSRDDLENCKLVCKQWNWVIDYGDKSLQRRILDVVVLSSCREFSIDGWYGLREQKFCFKKYFKNRDIKGAEVRIKRNALPPLRQFSCGRCLLSDVGKNEKFTDFGFHERFCKQFLRTSIYNQSVAYDYASKLFTPPLEFYERLAWLLKDCKVKLLVFDKFTFTDLFVEKFREYMPQPFCVDQLSIHCCRLRSIHTNVFHDFLGDAIWAERYFLETLRYALPDHINTKLLEKQGIRRAKIFYVGCATNRYNTNFRFNLRDDDFLNFIQTLLPSSKQSQRNKDETSSDRQFFGIFNSAITLDTIKAYKKIYSSGKNQRYLFEQILFGNERWYPGYELVQQQNRRHNVNNQEPVEDHFEEDSDESDGLGGGWGDDMVYAIM